jgi:hypothetical protein
MNDTDRLRQIFESDQAGMHPRPTLRQSHDRVLQALTAALLEAERNSDRVAVRTYCQLIDALKTLYPSVYPGWQPRRDYWPYRNDSRDRGAS